jgi:hypothetical protein
MSSEHSVTHWIDQLKAGDQAAAQKLWEGYFHRLVRLARTKLQGAPKRAADEEDVALSAFDSFCQGVERGRFPQLADRDDLWRLLVTLTDGKPSAPSARSPAGSRLPSWPPWWPRSTADFSRSSKATTCAQLPFGKWKETPPRR